jgi:anti-sigma B factor antagonist
MLPGAFEIRVLPIPSVDTRGDSAIPALKLSHRISPAGEAVVDFDGELDIATADLAVSYIREIIDRHSRPVVADLLALAFCDARGLAALVLMAGYAEQMGFAFRISSPSVALVKIMRISGLDRRFLTVQMPGHLRSCPGSRTGSLAPDSK